MHEVRVALCGNREKAGASFPKAGADCKMHIVVGAEGLHTMTVEHGWALARGSTKAESAETPPRGITAFEGAGEIELLTI